MRRRAVCAVSGAGKADALIPRAIFERESDSETAFSQVDSFCVLTGSRKVLLGFGYQNRSHENDSRIDFGTAVRSLRADGDVDRRSSGECRLPAVVSVGFARQRIGERTRRCRAGCIRYLAKLFRPKANALLVVIRILERRHGLQLILGAAHHGVVRIPVVASDGVRSAEIR